MKRKFIILNLALLGMLLLTAQTCATGDKAKTRSSTEKTADEEIGADDDQEEKEEESDLTEEELTELDDEIGGADFNLSEAWDKFDQKNYKASAELLGLAADYLEGEGEDLEGEDADHLLATTEKIKGLILALEKDEVNVSKIKSSFNQVGLNLVKDYLAIAISINESPEDNEYYVEKAIVLLERIIPNLESKAQSSVKILLEKIIAFDERVANGTLTDADNLQDFTDEIQRILEVGKIYF